MDSFDSALRALIDKWRALGESAESIADALQDELEAIDEQIVEPHPGR